jgi:hypothetical protein
MVKLEQEPESVLQDNKAALTALLNTIMENLTAVKMEQTCIAVNAFDEAFEKVKVDWIIKSIVKVITPSMNCLSYGRRSGAELHALAEVLWVAGFKLACVPEDFDKPYNKAKYLDIVIPMLMDLNSVVQP